MLNQILKLAYCPGCGKNVAHRRRVNGIFDGLMQTLRIGPWVCLHCQRKRMLLPAVRRDAADNLAVHPSDLVDSEKPEVWSSARPAVAEVMKSSKRNSVDEIDGQERLNSLNENFVNGGVDFNNGLNVEKTQDNRDSQVQPEIQTGSKTSLVSDEQLAEVNVSSKPRVLILEEADRKNSAVSNSQSTRTDKFESEVVPEAEPVGNFIKDQSLVLQSSRLDRFTEKFRDSVVERILTGQVSISSLTADGAYCESELVSWIADKAKRQNDEGSSSRV